MSGICSARPRAASTLCADQDAQCREEMTMSYVDRRAPYRISLSGWKLCLTASL
jgi:hypothetical protein